jgi:integrase
MSIRRDSRMLNAQGLPAFVIDYKDEYGRRKQTRTEACTLKDAQRVEREILTKIDKAKALGLSTQALAPLTFAKFAEETFLPVTKQTVRESTYKRYEDLYTHVKAFFGGMRLSSINNEAVYRYVEKTAKEPTRQSEVPSRQELVHRKNLLGAVLKMALRRGLIPFNPADAVEIKESKEEKHRRRTRQYILTLEDERKILGAAPAWLRPIITVGIYGGMRQMEIAFIRWEDVKDGCIHIPDSKTGEERYVPLNPVLRAVLQGQDRAILDGRPVPFVFWNAASKSTYKGSRISERFSAIAARLGIPATFHSTRHTFVTRARSSGVKDVDVMAITGHKSGRMLARYTHVQAKQLIGATDVLCRKDAEQVQNQAANQ